MITTTITLNSRQFLFSDLKLYLVVSLFVIASLFTPALFHNFGLNGQIFLPLYFFSVLGGITFGWRAGLLIGLLNPLISFIFSGMPALSLLPFILAKSFSIGFTSGFLIQKYQNKKLVSFLSILFSQIIGLSLIFTATHNLQLALMDFKIGYLGLLLQLLLVPILSKKISSYGNQISPRDI
jgi:thiamine transporter ThiT